MPTHRNIEELQHQPHYYYDNVPENQPMGLAYQSNSGPTSNEPVLGPTLTQEDL